MKTTGFLIKTRPISILKEWSECNMDIHTEFWDEIDELKEQYWPGCDDLVISFNYGFLYLNFRVDERTDQNKINDCVNSTWQILMNYGYTVLSVEM